MKTFFINFVFLIFLMNANAQCIDSNVNINYERISYTNGQPCTSKIKSKIKVNNASSYSSMFVRVIDVDDSRIALKQKTFKIKRVASDGSWQYSWTANYSSPTIKRMKIEHYLIKKSNNTRVLVCSKTLYQCENDYDEDGVSNHQDHCIYESGPVSNNGCPIQPLSKPNLTFKRFRIMDGSTTLLDYPNGNNNAPTLKKGKTYDFKVEVINDQSNSSAASSVSLELLFSNNTEYFYPDPRAEVYNVDTDADIGSINAGSTKEKTFKVRVEDNIGVSPNLINGSGNLFYLDIDFRGKIDESNEEDNILQIGVYYSSSSSGNSQVNEPYEVQVFNLSGIFLIKKTVNSKEEENIFLNNMPIPGYGPYIVKNGTETYKFVRGRR